MAIPLMNPARTIRAMTCLNQPKQVSRFLIDMHHKRLYVNMCISVTESWSHTMLQVVLMAARRKFPRTFLFTVFA